MNKIFATLVFLPFFISGQENESLYDSINSLYNAEDYKKIIGFEISALDNYKDLELANLNFILAKSYENLNKEDSALVFYRNALKQYKSINSFEEVAKTNLEIYLLLDSQNNLELDRSSFLNEVLEYAKASGSKKWMAHYYTNLGVYYLKESIADSAKYYFQKALDIAKNIDNTKMQINLDINLGSLYSRKYRDNDSAIYYYNNALKSYYSDTLNSKDLNVEFNLFNNIGNAFRRKKDYQKSLEYYHKAESMELPKLHKKSKKILFSNMDATYYYMMDWEKAYDYLYKYDSIKDIINLQEQNSKITDIEEKYQNQKLRADNIESEAKRKQNRNLLLGSLGLLLFGGVTFLLIQKNTKRKQLLAEQEKELQTQKLATVLKEQELTSIDAMIEGQEKERQRIANDLHDDLGGLMATVKLHFNALKEKQSPEFDDKTDKLLTEAYNKVRSVAHTKNSGVMAKKGLLKAINDMAKTISASNKLHIDVIDHGLESRLENSLELTIFRIIQELITNIIKHAEATEATIHITNHEDSLNIMVEDNGKGFDTKNISKKNGMGIHSIDKRIENLGGTVTIESEHKKGTTVIIDIPS